MLACHRTSADYNWTRTKLLEYREEEVLPREGVLSFWPAPDRGRQQKPSPTCDDKASRYPGSSRRAKSHARRLPRDLPRRPSFDGNLVPSEEGTSIGTRFQASEEVSPSFRSYCRYHLYPIIEFTITLKVTQSNQTMYPLRQPLCSYHIWHVKLHAL